jgi:hypothetical protein
MGKRKELTNRQVNIILVLGGAMLAIFFMAILLDFISSPVEGSFECKLNGIELVNVSPDNCYGDFQESHCPIPKDIYCKGSGKLPAYMLSALE